MKFDIHSLTSPAQLRELDDSAIAALCGDIRAEILDAVSACGGHLASNLGIVEMTVALHRVFSSPRDSILFDVGHQCYAHKILTGRLSGFSELRRPGGVSGFPSREESEHDPFTSGHSGTSLSAALGIAEANRIMGSDAWTVAVIGDGSFGNGMIYEALNDCAHRGLHLMIVLNDNDMSISPNVGALSDYFTKIRVSRGYFRFKHAAKKIFSHIPLVGGALISVSVWVKELIKRTLNRKNIFEDFGLEYLGPVDGAQEAALESVFREAMKCDVPCIVHVVTRKGRGYLPAEEHPDRYHSVPPFDLAQGVQENGRETYSDVFGAQVCSLAQKDARIAAITAAMRDGTGLSGFAALHPDRFFDVGIAEEHAVTFAAGLARAGMRPITAIYSTFSQRAFDQVLHDAALQKLPMVLALDRCGIVAGDGATHQGLYDVGLFSPIPGVEIYAPEGYGELRETLERAVSSDAVSIVRYPRGREAAYDRTIWRRTGDVFTADFGAGAPQAVIVSYGRESVEALKAADLCAERGIPVRVIRPLRLLPFDEGIAAALPAGVKTVHIAEEAMRRGGYGELLSSRLPAGMRGVIHAADGFVRHGDEAALLRGLGLDAQTLAESVMAAH